MRRSVKGVLVCTVALLVAYCGYSWYLTTKYDRLRDKVDTQCVIFNDAIPIFANDSAEANKQTAELLKLYRSELCQK